MSIIFCGPLKHIFVHYAYIQAELGNKDGVPQILLLITTLSLKLTDTNQNILTI
jgi:hypothetical protein